LTYALHEEYTLKGATIATRAASKWGGVMIKLSGLSPCLLYSVFYLSAISQLLGIQTSVVMFTIESS